MIFALSDTKVSKKLQDALDLLSEKQRAPIVLSLAGYSYEEISGFSGVSESTIANETDAASIQVNSEWDYFSIYYWIVSVSKAQKWILVWARI